MIDLDRLLREPAVARITGFSVHTLRQWRSLNYHDKGPPWVKIGASVVYRESDVRAWMSALEANSASVRHDRTGT
ncbi:helix-turn-helix transcriptional regulator [Arthrobacter castelli]|uniref:helix-turn-helix transcriptional regulator n=1 Tax=Arthrobacter castelli TaxID=271431 RepID=UPI0012DDF609|nr:AlpA family phage regulatory protein [Arthrobacter castelli]